MRLADWLSQHPRGDFRSGIYSAAETPQPELCGMGFKVGDILCVPHGPWTYLFGVVSVDDTGRIDKHELISAH